MIVSQIRRVSALVNTHAHGRNREITSLFYDFYFIYYHSPLKRQLINFNEYTGIQ
ncbi:hypothetical protein EPYR_01338 [Erwinia pyrifoliae DSM 12163]|nr:hypothetical protein EPYR_01338 [Erwinia pyrifoliae DSM 12163]